MAKERFEHRTLKGKINVACKFDDGTVRYWTTNKEEVVEHIKEIVTEYLNEGYVLTLRQLHYQLVTKNWIVNHDTAYKKLGNILDDCRYSGVIDWAAIEDRGRVPYIPYSVKDVADALNDTIEQYRLNRQNGQTNHVELWTEKDALSGILKRTTEEYHIQLVVNKGYTSSSAAYNAYRRCVNNIVEGKKVTILYFGDHDPSGLDMIRDIRERLLFFLIRGARLTANSNFWETVQDWAKEHYWDEYADRELTYEENMMRAYLSHNELFNVIPIGLTMAQIKKYDLPPNPTKLTDSRANKYIKKFGKTCWEVDALKPQVLTAIVETNIKQQINIDTFNSMKEQEERDIEQLKGFIKSRDEE